ncbi:MAG: aspartate-semialdehyde dehydrogenase [Bacteriovoracaceae bacterium]|nr:aspartate-semialdehyde dehydrogenase [Bacteriovoracaceae bacterium]
MSGEKLKLGFVGWRGMVGSVLLDRMHQENDFEYFDTVFFSTSQKGEKAPDVASVDILWDAFDCDGLKKMDIILTCQGGDYTSKIHGELRKADWRGIWVDAASTLRMKDNACLVLDPLNKGLIKDEIHKGTLDFIGANCTVSLMLLALAGPIKANMVEWISTHTYQAASGAGAQNMKELLKQMGHLYKIGENLIEDPHSNILELDKLISHELQGKSNYPQDLFGAPLAGSLIPWIDSPMENGQTREEWKAMVEGNKILGLGGGQQIAVDGTCVRIGAMRSHSQAITLKCKSDVNFSEFSDLISEAHDWLDFVPNNKEDTLKRLSPANYSGSLNIGVGRVRPMNLGKEFVNVFTVGDQLLWGAAEPLRRFLRLYLEVTV